MPTVPSKKQLDEQKPKFPLLPQEDYILKVESIEPSMQWDFNHTEEIEVMKAVFSIVSLKDGSIAVDEDGQRVHEKRRMMRDFDENRMGYMQDGTPSLTRQFVCYMLGVSPFAEDQTFEYEWKDFVGKTIATKIIQYMVKKGKNAGQVGNKIDCFLPQKKKLEGIPIIEEDPQGTMSENAEDIDVKKIPY